MSETTWEHYNELLLDSDVDRIRKLMIRSDLFKISSEIPGDIVECGVFKGSGMMYWLKLLAIYAPASMKRVIGFDSFGGFPESVLPHERANVDKYVAEANLVGVDAESVWSRVTAAGFEERAEIVIGPVENEVAEYVEKNSGFRISLLNLDLDTYAGTKAALEALYPVVSRGGVIVLDEYADRGWGESDAVDEFLKDKDVLVKSVPHSTRPTGYFIKP